MKIKKKLSFFGIFLVLIVSLLACGQAKTKEEILYEKAEHVIKLLADKDYQSIEKMISPTLATEVNADTLEKTFAPYVDPLGKFQAIVDKTYSQGNDPIYGDLDTALVTCQFENGEPQFSISFDKEGLLCGLYIK